MEQIKLCVYIIKDPLEKEYFDVCSDTKTAFHRLYDHLFILYDSSGTMGACVRIVGTVYTVEAVHG